MNELDASKRGQILRKYVFVGGSPRSGTSLLGRNIGRMENCSGLANTGVFEDEGQFLQDVYPTASAYGGSSRCAFDPRMHRTESSELLAPEKVARLSACWHAYWDNNKSIFVEKTPENFLMTRFLQTAFCNSYFVVLRRHPVPVSMAGQRWTSNFTSLNRMYQHWLQCYRLFEEDKKYLKHVYELSYEDYVENPDKYHHEIAAFIGTSVPEPPKEDTFRLVLQWRRPPLRVPDRAMERLDTTHNKRYFDRWSFLLTKAPFKAYYRYIARKYEPEFARYGYSLIEGFLDKREIVEGDSKLSALIGPVYCAGADLAAFLRRSAIRTKGTVRRGLRALVPEFVRNRVRQARRDALLKQQRA
jgi:Sulfotransferase family